MGFYFGAVDVGSCLTCEEEHDPKTPISVLQRAVENLPITKLTQLREDWAAQKNQHIRMEMLSALLYGAIDMDRLADMVELWTDTGDIINGSTRYREPELQGQHVCGLLDGAVPREVRHESREDGRQGAPSPLRILALKILKGWILRERILALKIQPFRI